MLPADPIRILSPSSPPGPPPRHATVRAQLALPGAPVAATARHVSSYYDDNRTHDEKAVVSGVGPKGGKAKLAPPLRQALHDAAYAFGDDGSEGSEDVLLVLPGATILTREHGGPAILTAIVADPGADPSRGFHGFAVQAPPEPVLARLAAHAPPQRTRTAPPPFCSCGPTPRRGAR